VRKRDFPVTRGAVKPRTSGRGYKAPYNVTRFSTVLCCSMQLQSSSVYVCGQTRENSLTEERMRRMRLGSCLQTRDGRCCLVRRVGAARLRRRPHIAGLPSRNCWHALCARRLWLPTARYRSRNPVPLNFAVTRASENEPASVTTGHLWKWEPVSLMPRAASSGTHPRGSSSEFHRN